MSATVQDRRGGPVSVVGPEPHRRAWWTIGAALVALVAAAVQKLPCGSTRWSSHQVTHQLCYNDITKLYFERAWQFPAVPYRDYAFEYPALNAMFSYAAAAAAAGYRWIAAATFLPELNDTFVYYVANLLGLAVCGVLAALLVSKLAGPRWWTGYLLVAMPSFLVAAFINWDLLAAMFTVAALWFWQRGRGVAAGACIGLGAAAKFFPLLLLWPLLMVCLRTRRLRDFAKCVGAAMLMWAVVNAPFAMSGDFRPGWLLFYNFSGSRGDDLGSLWYILHHLMPVAWSADRTLQNVGAAVLLLACLGGIALLILRAPRLPALPQLALLTISAFLLTNKVWSPQFVIWLLPLVVLAVPRPLWLMGWQAAELSYFVAVWWFLNPADAPVVLSEPTFIAVSVFRWLAVAGLCAVVIRDLLREHSTVSLPRQMAVRARGLLLKAREG